MTKLRFVLTLPELDQIQGGGTIQNPMERFAPLMIALEALVKINEWHLNEAIKRGRPLPRLYESGIYYEEEPPGQEDWLDTPSLYAAGKGDCEDLACALAAERRVYDRIPAVASIKQKFITSNELRSAGYPKRIIPRDGIYLVHVVTELPGGGVEDPSKLLGMQGEFS